MIESVLPLLAQGQQQPGGGSLAGLLVPLLLMFAVFYFALIRPQQRRQREQRALIESVEVGDAVVTIGGMLGTVRAVEDAEIVVEVADGVEVRFLKSSIARRLVGEDAAGDLEGDEEEAGEQR